MGIPGLATYMEEKFKEWKPLDYERWNHVIIDGSNVFKMLYKENFPWALGGEYDQFSAEIKKFFEKYPFKNPIVVFDGPHYNENMNKEWEEIRKESSKDLQEVQKQEQWSTDKKQASNIVPLLVISTAIETLKAMPSIKVYMADAVADGEIAALANHYKCPVVSSDADFFVFNLEYGLIYLQMLYKGNDCLYFMSDLLEKRELCLLIPAYFGNDDVKGIERKHSPDDYSSFIGELKKYDSCDKYLGNQGGLPQKKRISPARYEKMKKFYWEAPLPRYYENAELPNNYKLPKWVYISFKEGKFSKRLLNAYINKVYLAPKVVESECAWQISQNIRQHLYSIMGGDEKVTEFIRPQGKVRLRGMRVKPEVLRQDLSIKNDTFTKKEEIVLSNLVLELLECHSESHKDTISPEDIESEFNTLDNKWKLPIASTVYWYRSLCKMTPPPVDPETMKRLVMSLLLTFLMTSGTIGKKSSFEPVTSETKSKHLKALHAFAQWQCVYLDAMALNYLAREPFCTTNPSCLYSGSTAMHLALNSGCMLDGYFDNETVEGQLLNKLLYLVTGHDEEGRKGRHFMELRSGESDDSSFTEVRRR